MKTRILILLFAAVLSIPAAQARHGRGGVAASGPLALPLLTSTQAASMFTHLGSFTIPSSNGFSYGGSAVSVNGSTMYTTSLVYEPVNLPNSTSQVTGVGALTLPSSLCSGYTGGSACTATVNVSPRQPGITPTATYTLTAAPASGATCATFTPSLPAGIAANAGWFLDFSGNSATDDMQITSVGTCNGADSVGWATGLSTSYGISVPVYQWNPEYNYITTVTPAAGDTSITLKSLPYGVAVNAGWYIAFNNTNVEEITGISGDTVSWANALTSAGGGFTTSTAIYHSTPQGLCSLPGGGNMNFTGSLVQNGTLYLTCGGQYDGNNNNQLGWILTAPTNLNGTWGVASPASGTATSYVTGGGTGAEDSRYFAGPVYPVPTIWQPYVGKYFEAGFRSFSVAGTAQPWGPTFQSFDLSTVSPSGTAVSLTSALGYYGTTSPVNQQLGGRAFSGPFPDQNGYSGPYYPATLSVAPVQNDTSEQIVLPTAQIQFTATVATSGEMNVTAFSTTPFSNSGITYNLTGTSIPSGATMQPSFDYAPGATLTTGTYWEGDPPSSAITTPETLTATPNGYQSVGGQSTEWTMFFSDGESREGIINSSGVFTFSPALTGCTSGNPCTTSVQVAPMGDKWENAYDGQNGGGFIVPGTSTYVAFYVHEYGIQRPRDAESTCGPGSSESWWAPLYPDTQNYQSVGMYLYKMSDIVKGYDGSQQPYVANPYGYMQFPDQSNLFSGSCPGDSLPGYSGGWEYFDPTDDIWYVAQGGNPTVIDEYRVTPP